MIHLQNVNAGYENRRILHDINAFIKKGEFFGIVGPNGSGKTTLLNTLTNTIPFSGDIFIDHDQIKGMSAKERARKLAVLMQRNPMPFAYTVKEIVEMGRYPQQKGWLNTLRARDYQVVNEVLEAVDVKYLSTRSIASLSGGEWQRVLLARALAQEADGLLLDEPTNHLDVHHQIHLLNTIDTMARRRNITVVAIFHDLNLASLYCDRILVLQEGRAQAIGPPEKVLTPDLLQQVYGSAVIRKSHVQTHKPVFYINRQKEAQLPLNLQVNSYSSVLTWSTPVKVYSELNCSEAFEWYKGLSLACQSDGSLLPLRSEGHPTGAFYLYDQSEHDTFHIYWLNAGQSMDILLVILKAEVVEVDIIKLYHRLLIRLQGQTHIILGTTMDRRQTIDQEHVIYHIDKVLMKQGD